jgi:hypothetical protein
VVPSNEWRGYVLRKIMRRAMRHGKKLGFVEPVLHAMVPVLVREMGEAYPQLIADQDNVRRIVRSEEERFDAVLTAGPAAAGGRARPRRIRVAGWSPATRPSGSTTRLACRWTSWRTWPASAGIANRSRRLRARDEGAA